MGIYLKLTSNAPSATGLVLLNGTTDTGYVRVSGGDWGMVDSQPLISSSIDTEGGAAVGQNVPNRTISLPLCISASTAAATQALFTTLAGVVSECQRFGGKLRFRPSNASYGVTFEVEHVKVVGDHWTKTAELGAAIMVELSLTCRPYALADPMSFVDEFTTSVFTTGGKFNDGGADYTADAGALSNIPISTSGTGSITASANLSTRNIVIQTGNSNSLGDVSCWSKFTVGSTLTGFEFGFILKRIDASNYIRAYLYDDGANTYRKVDAVIAGVATNIVSGTTTRLVAGSTYYWRVGIRGHVIDYEVHSSTTYPCTVSPSRFVMTDTTQISTFGGSVTGRVGILFTPIHTGSSIENFNVVAYSHKDIYLPDTLRLRGAIPGDVAAPTAMSFMQPASLSKPAVIGWMPRLPAHNVIQNSGFETSTGGYVVSAVAGVAGAATSITRTTTAAKVYEGTAAGELVCPATADTGVSYLIYKRFKKGVKYSVSCKAISTGGSTTAMRLKLGVSGDITSETQSALTTSWQTFDTEWTPTADTDVAYFALTTNTATATTMQFDRVMVWEGSTTTEPAITQGGEPAFGVIDCATVDPDNKGSFFTITATGTCRSGYALRGTGAPSTNGYAEWWMHPWTLTPDDGSRAGQCLVDVYLRCDLPSTQTSGTMVLSALHDIDSYAAERFTLQYGSTGKAIVLPSSGTPGRGYFLGTLPLWVDRDNPEAIKLRLEYTASGGASGDIDFDYLVLVPSMRCATTITGVSDTNYPRFLPVAAYEKLVYPNLSGVVRRHMTYQETPDTGLSGAQIALPPGEVDVVAWLPDKPIDNTDSDTTDMSVESNCWVGFEPQPRRLMMGPS